MMGRGKQKQAQAGSEKNPQHVIFTHTRQPCEQGRIFVAMPFEAPHSHDLWGILGSICNIYGFTVHRGDSSPKPNRIMADVVEQLERAEIAIADLTGRNPNVMYELGMAQNLCEAVILISQDDQKLPFDLQDLRCIHFNLSDPDGCEKFSQDLGGTLKAIRETVPPLVIEDPVRRTREIISDLNALYKATKNLKEETIWYSGFLSSFAIGPCEGFDTRETDYQKALYEEKAALMRLAKSGCQMYCIISPPTYDLILERAQFAKARITHLLEFLKSGNPALENIFWATSPYRQKNMHIIGKRSCFEGFSKPLQPGYGLTLRQSSPDAIAANIALYRTLFDTLATHTLDFDRQAGKRNPIQSTDRKTALREATVHVLEESLEICEMKTQSDSSS